MPDVCDTKRNIRVIHAEVKTYLKHKHGFHLINHGQGTSVNVIKKRDQQTVNSSVSKNYRLFF